MFTRGLDTRDLVRALKAAEAGEDAFVAAVSAPGFDPTAFAEFVRGHRLLGFVDAVARGERVPAAVRAVAAVDREERRARVDRLVADALELREAFERARVDVLWLKGLGFGARFYGDVRRRHQFDLDVLVRERDVERAIATMSAAGYAFDPGRIGAGAVRRSLSRGPTQVDVHWHLRRRARRRVPEGALWASPAAFDLAGASFATLSDEDTVLFLLLAVCGDLRRGARVTRPFLDLWLLLRAREASLDWAGLFRGLSERALLRPCVNVLAVFLAVWEAAGEFPRLVAALERHGALVEIADAAEAVALVERPAGDPANEVWFRRAYPYGRADFWARSLTVDLPHAISRLARRRRFLATVAREPAAS